MDHLVIKGSRVTKLTMVTRVTRVISLIIVTRVFATYNLKIRYKFG